jgi:hypothetical protein
MTAARAAIVGALLGGPTALAFFAGGYFDRPRLWAGIAAWIAVAVAAIACVRAWPRTRGAWLALGGLAALFLWTVVSIAWAPLRDAAQADAQRTLVYLGALVAGTAAFRDRRTARAIEPALAFGALLIVCEGLSERIFPGRFQLSRDVDAAGRLDQPLTYWNATGIVAAMGVVLLVRIAGDFSRARALRLAAVAAGPVMAVALYLTLSRGAILAVVVGLVVLVLLAPTRAQAGALALMAIGAVAPIIAAASMAGVRTLQASLSTREAEGLVLLAVLITSTVVSTVAMSGIIRRSDSGPPPAEPDPAIRRVASAAGVAVAIATVVLVVFAATSSIGVTQAPNATNNRLVSGDTIRGNFWRVAAKGFAEHPIRGTGAGGYETEWRRHRPVLYSTLDAHSLYLETLSELGVVGMLALVTLFSGVAVCARRAFRLDPGVSAGWIAIVSMWAVHAGLDWDWEMSAVTLFVIPFVAAILALADGWTSVAQAPVAVRSASEVAPVAAAG